MARNILSWIAAFSFSLSACNTAYADRVSPTPPQRGGVLAPVPVESPYQVELIGENGVSLKTYQHRGRIYVLGAAGQRYSIRVSNPTNRRVEAVLSVDGLDVIDGRTAAVSKRGYVVQPYGTLVVDGFRVSTEQVAAFRFSSVNNSYAGRKGQARNVGVIGVAIFEEQAQPQIVMPPPPPPSGDPTWGPDYWLEEESDGIGLRDTPAPRPEPRPSQRPPKVMNKSADSLADAPSPAGGAPGSVRSRAESAPPPSAASSAEGRYGGGAPAPMEPSRQECCNKPERPGLGTEFGEHRYSTVSWTRFVRANANRPSAVVEMRYNDASGLRGLGIAIEPPVEQYEIMTRETANPFPDSRFAEPPR